MEGVESLIGGQVGTRQGKIRLIVDHQQFNIFFKNLDCARFGSFNARFSRCSREVFATRLLFRYLIFSFLIERFMVESLCVSANFL